MNPESQNIIANTNNAAKMPPHKNGIAVNKLWQIKKYLGLRRHEIPIALLLLTLGVIILFLSHNVAYNRTLTSLKLSAENNARLHLSVFQSELDKLRTIPIILADDAMVIDVLRHPTNTKQISAKMENLKTKTGAAVIYILNDKGIGIASSNWQQADNFIGQDYSFRDYFKGAVKNGQAEQFALGSVSHKSGLYFSNAIKDTNEIDKTIGISVVKIEFDNIETLWASMNGDAYIVNGNNDVLISSNPKMRFKPLPIIKANQFSTTLPVSVSNWKFVQISSDIEAQTAGTIAFFICLMSEIIIALFIIWLRNNQIQIKREIERDKNYRADLERNVTERTAELSAEIKERKEAEAKLREMQSDLVQANKLATLGQITAGVAHEINQPLATIQILAENAVKLNNNKTPNADNMVTENLNNIVRMAERIGKITSELRNFTRKARGTNEITSINEIIESSLILASSRIRQNHVKLGVAPINTNWKVMGEKVRLEQIIVNLLQNAFEALDNNETTTTAPPKIDIKFTEDDATITIMIIDNGGGIDAEIKPHLFTPFKTTKPKGVGLGLNISGDIARDLGARLYYDDTQADTTFCLKLNKVL